MKAARLVLLALALAAPVALVACDDGDSRPPPAVDGVDRAGAAGGGGVSREGGAASPDAGGDGGTACNDLVATDGPAVDQLAAVGDPPIGTGGAVESGTYQLTDVRLYGQGAAGSTGLSNRGLLALEVTAGTGTFTRAVTTTSQAGTVISEVRDAGGVVISGTTMVFTATCPAARSEQLAFTSTATTLVVTNTSTRESYTFTRR